MSEKKSNVGTNNWYLRRAEVDRPTDLRGQVAVITGASGGIGRATGLLLAEAGAKVCLGARRLDALQEVVREITAKGGHAIAVKTDISKRAEVKNLVALAEKEFGPVDILVNNAAAWYFTMMTSLHEDDWEQMVDVNCKVSPYSLPGWTSSLRNFKSPMRASRLTQR
ncbi:glucose 1-dehydrogenase 3 [Elysia marginata]|uniref:Glucose 1-dehydrogenase 3 n=1 Tax=Elysia marginata TaxID=1093978 RepID=A0AAV4FMG9_9GAST|nr:glucose 1-dehydrogenase 3 [Elysia marginata]